MNSGKSGEKVEAAEVTTEKPVEPTSTVTEPTTIIPQPSVAPTEAPIIPSQAAETSPSSESSTVIDSSVTTTVSDSPPTETLVVIAAGIIPVVQSAKVDNAETTQGTEAITEASTTGKNAASLTTTSLTFSLLIVTFQFLLNK